MTITARCVSCSGCATKADVSPPAVLNDKLSVLIKTALLFRTIYFDLIINRSAGELASVKRKGVRCIGRLCSRSIKPDRITESHTPADLRRDVLDEGDVVVEEPVRQVEGVDRKDVREVLAGKYVRSCGVEDSVSGRSVFVNENPVLISNCDNFGPYAEITVMSVQAEPSAKGRNTRQRCAIL